MYQSVCRFNTRNERGRIVFMIQRRFEKESDANESCAVLNSGAAKPMAPGQAIEREQNIVSRCELEPSPGLKRHAERSSMHSTGKHVSLRVQLGAIAPRPR